MNPMSFQWPKFLWLLHADTAIALVLLVGAAT
jgi:hypothetical protein